MKVIGLLAALALTSCSDNSFFGKETSNSADSSSKEMVNYNLRMTQVAFGLTDASAYTITVEGCASGYTSTVTEASPYLAVYKYDIGCLAKLTSLTVNSIVYVPSMSSPFTTWDNGDTAVFEDNAGSGKTLNLQVIAQLDNPIPGTTPTHGVEYLFSTIETGTSQNCTGECIENQSGVTISGADAPAFEVDEFLYVNMATNGSGIFQFKLECNEALVGSDTTGTCAGAALSGAKYKLVPDTYNGVLSMADASTIMQSDTLVIDDAEVFAAGSDANSPNGGFLTKELLGPAQMHLNPEMILVVQMGTSSYKYWNVDITPIVQP